MPGHHLADPEGTCQRIYKTAPTMQPLHQVHEWLSFIKRLQFMKAHTSGHDSASDLEKEYTTAHALANWIATSTPGMRKSQDRASPLSMRGMCGDFPSLSDNTYVAGQQMCTVSCSVVATDLCELNITAQR